MDLKRALQTILVLMSCSLCNFTGAQQRMVYIPENYAVKNVETEFKADGPKLLFSDSPETVYNNGILYRDKVDGDVRLFLHHVNGRAENKKLAVVLKNTDSLRPIKYTIERRGEAAKAHNYLIDGKNAQKIYFDDSKQKPEIGQLGYENSKELLSGRGVILAADRLYTAIIDMHFEKPVEISVLMCETKSDIELFNESAAVLPMDEHPLRGTFENSNWHYTIKEPLSDLLEPVYIDLAGWQEGYIKGIDATTGKNAENYGNYGVVYEVNFTIAGDKPQSLIFNPIGGYFAGYGILENKTKKERHLLALPEGRLSVGETVEEAVDLGVLETGEYSFIWSPPGASNLPVQLIWESAGINK